MKLIIGNFPHKKRKKQTKYNKNKCINKNNFTTTTSNYYYYYNYYCFYFKHYCVDWDTIEYKKICNVVILNFELYYSKLIYIYINSLVPILRLYLIK